MVTATDGYGKQGMIVRLTGKKLECYVATDEFLETVDNINSRRSLVKYKFDDGPVVQQEWTLSDDNTALFYPGNPTAFIQKLRNARRFVIEYKPSDTIPQTISLDVSLFPPGIVADPPSSSRGAKATGHNDADPAEQ